MDASGKSCLFGCWRFLRPSSSVQLMALAGFLDTSSARQIAARGSLSGALIGGIVFGVGMILTRGCASRLLVLSANGNMRALLRTDFCSHCTGHPGWGACPSERDHQRLVDCGGRFFTRPSGTAEPEPYWWLDSGCDLGVCGTLFCAQESHTHVLDVGGWHRHWHDGGSSMGFQPMGCQYIFRSCADSGHHV